MVAVVTIWPPESHWSRAAWVGVFFCLTLLEINTLYRERTENQEQQATARKEEENRFAGILASNQKQFEATMKRSDAIMSSTREATSFASGGMHSHLFFRPK